jgi:hypothetical protein
MRKSTDHAPRGMHARTRACLEKNKTNRVASLPRHAVQTQSRRCLRFKNSDSSQPVPAPLPIRTLPSPAFSRPSRGLPVIDSVSLRIMVTDTGSYENEGSLNLYAILGIEKGATVKEVRPAVYSCGIPSYTYSINTALGTVLVPCTWGWPRVPCLGSLVQIRSLHHVVS